MTSNSSTPSVVLQKAIISANLNSSLMLFYLTGVYIGVYAVTIHIYRESYCTVYVRHAATVYRCIIIGTLTALCATLLGQVIGDWYYTNILFCIQNVSRAALFDKAATAASVPAGIYVIATVLENIGFLFANGIMVWRCVRVCECSLLRALPIGLFLMEIALAVINTVVSTLFYSKPASQTAKKSRELHHILGATDVSVVSTMVTTTFIICRYILCKTSDNNRSRTKYKHIIEILMQSCMMYTTVMLVQTFVTFLNTGSLQGCIILTVLDSYFEGLVNVANALAPTLMVARLASASNFNKQNDATSLEIPSHLDRSEDGSGESHDSNYNIQEDESLEDKHVVIENNDV